ncbi:MAG: hypothetical protein CO186_03360 [Zetaproteobacteria bacterium CG_4_9_14_3_um_filter_49_83]|nr:MAG: hypothetical protein AUJ56_00080 [Zetaproteobacteria bacterium CG1_02_49_23]PIQ32544.1 MAG: hypothetical protein COW62_07265 [Zetaproteobacteria bacterium CG17_big_fil_post_rev_8_21_14_2_50_50_13]PIV31133.1 MAG: hypothetical protein COS35_02900 [Zetaproteobacteria bacterium CG02_land_8_20_14_3_00_50_9]PIY56120.1 MAG: hypothetical protein COZ00_05755 [Zetaproteobacteria bacterium CG_4_10_14_0_8_um_filter_49_80]PJA35901.1 MAG: hypothetical protein CO186_03360 [Zetaproteobacteria bacterium
MRNVGHLHYARFFFDRADDALTHVREGVRLQPTCHFGWMLLGDIDARAGRKREALAAYERSAVISDSAEIRVRIIDMRKLMGLWKD